MTGKEKCAFLKRVREKVASKHGLSGFDFEECSYKGTCFGTCPACEADLERLTASVSALKSGEGIPTPIPMLKPVHGAEGLPEKEVSCRVFVPGFEPVTRGDDSSPEFVRPPVVQGGIRPPAFDATVSLSSTRDVRVESSGGHLPVFGIVRHRIETDGPGVVTLVGVQGCPLSCRYCINAITPDAVLYEKNTLFSALVLDSVYFEETGGGVCFGGHEPLLHADFILQFIKFVKSKGLKWRFGIETSLNVHKYPRELFQLLDYIVVDIKSVDSDVYLRYTGGRNDLVLESLRRVASDPLVYPKVRVRVPLIPGFNDFRDVGKTVGFLTGTLGLPMSSIDMFEYTSS